VSLSKVVALLGGLLTLVGVYTTFVQKIDMLDYGLKTNAEALARFQSTNAEALARIESTNAEASARLESTNAEAFRRLESSLGAALSEMRSTKSDVDKLTGKVDGLQQHK
jgi:uncharacterized UPF0160 family protein